MKLSAPCYATDFSVYDVDGNLFQLSAYQGKPIFLSFFRDVSCLFSDSRLHELSAKYKQWAELGIDVVVVFSSSNKDIKKIISKHFVPFRVIGDPELKLYEQYRVEHSSVGLIKALFFNVVHIVSGFMNGARVDVGSVTGRLMPADFLIGPTGKILDLWYGRYATQHIPMKRLDLFVSRVKKAKQMQSQGELNTMSAEQKLIIDQQRELVFSDQLKKIKATLLNKELAQKSTQSYQEDKAA